MVKKKPNHVYLRKKLSDLWKLKETIILIDLGLDYYTVKLKEEKSQRRIAQGRPWFVAGVYLSIRLWEPNFVPTNSSMEFTAIWVRLPHPPTEFYDGQVLAKVGKSIGKLLKIDACKSATLRGWYVRICIQVPMDMPVKDSIVIEYIDSSFNTEERIFCVRDVED